MLLVNAAAGRQCCWSTLLLVDSDTQGRLAPGLAITIGSVTVGSVAIGSVTIGYCRWVLKLPQWVQVAIVAHARRDHPDEACGVVAGPAGTDRPDRLVEMINAERSPTFYRFDAGEQLRLWRDMDDRDEDPVIIYHSHTATEAYPSRTDVSFASEPGAHYVLVSTRDPEAIEVRSYRIVDGVVTEEEIELCD